MNQEPIAFLSYVRLDNQHENGRLSEFCARLGGEMRMQTGSAFHIFQDRNDIGWGQQWKLRIDESLDAATFLIPIVTPAFFNSTACRGEFERFLERERKLARNDLILPIYYVNCAVLGDEARCQADLVAREIASRQYGDWRELRFEPFTSPVVGKTLARMAGQIVAALDRDRPQKAAPTAPSAPTQPILIGASENEPTQESGRTLSASKAEPPTLVVDAMYRGDHTTIAAALQAAGPGYRILVRPGLYRESLIIEKPLEIIGDGELGDVVVESVDGNAVLFRASMGRISNIAFRQLAGGDWYCINITQGRLDLEGCDITSQALACVAIRDGADPRLRRNRIHDGKASGVLVQQNGLGTLEDNDIFANAFAGVAIRGGGNPILRRNRIHDQNQSGVFVYREGLGTLEDNEIVANASVGVEVKEGGNPTLRRNRISRNEYHAIRVYAEGRGTFEDNDLRENARGAWSIEEGCTDNLIRRRNQE